MIGIECEVDTTNFSKILQHFASLPYSFYISNYMGISDKHTIMPETRKSFYASLQQLESMSSHCIWEITLQLWPSAEKVTQLRTFTDYLNSDCMGAIIYYDCNYLEIYLKRYDELSSTIEILEQLGATMITEISESSKTGDGLREPF